MMDSTRISYGWEIGDTKLVGQVLSERSNANTNITGLPYFYAYEMEEIQTNDYSELFINKYLPY